MHSPIRLGVNVDHIATIRQARGTAYPDPVDAAFIAVEAGADGITVHLREDRRHIQERDVRLLCDQLTVPVNLEMAVTPAMVQFALEVRPEKCCIVPERREELTTEGGLDVCRNSEALTHAYRQLAQAGIEVSLFIDPSEAQIAAAAAIGVPVIELHTGAYAEIVSPEQQTREFENLLRAVESAVSENLQINAGHGLHYENVARLLSIPELVELNIGHAIVARALFNGLAESVREMKKIIRGSAL